MLVPLDTPTTLPVFDTFATDFLEEDQVTVDFALERLSCTDLPRVIEALVLLSAIFSEDAAAVCSEKKLIRQSIRHNSNAALIPDVFLSLYVIPLTLFPFLFLIFIHSAVCRSVPGYKP
jgi:hypothetical protein